MDNEDIPSSEKLQLLHLAMKAHKKYMIDAFKGRACDRHLLGLRVLATQEGSLPEIFTDKAYTESMNYRLSTSNIGGYLYIYGGFGNAAPDGYGICYRPRDNLVNFSIFCRHSCPETDSHDMGLVIVQALRDMRNLIVASTANL